VSDENLLLQFLGEGVCLIVEPSGAFSASIQICLRDLGVPAGQVVVAKKFTEAMTAIKEQKPKVLVTEYEIEKEFGLTLIEEQEKYHSIQSRLSVIVTKNGTDSAIAEAAEEQDWYRHRL